MPRYTKRKLHQMKITNQQQYEKIALIFWLFCLFFVSFIFAMLHYTSLQPFSFKKN